MTWYIHWDTGLDLSKGGIELSFRTYEDMTQLLVETEAIRRVESITERIGTPYISPRQHIVGIRGFGKSTLLNYIAFRLFSKISSQNVLPVYSSLLGSANNDKEIELIFFRSLLESLFDIPSDFERFRVSDMFSESSKRLTRAKVEFKKQLRDFGQVAFDYVYTAFENQLNHLCETFRRIVFIIDGLDKQEPALVPKFLRGTQERLNALINKYNLVFIDSADPSWRNTLDAKEFSGVRGSTISLRVWTVAEVEALIKKRLRAIGIYEMPFEHETLEILVQDFQGNPREILQYATTLLHYAARERLKTIIPRIARKILWTDDSKDKFYKEVIGNTDARYAFEKLRTIFKERQMMNILIATYNQKAQRISRNMNYDGRSSMGITVTESEFQRFLDILLSKGCLRVSKPQNYLELEADMRKLFDFITQMGQSLVALPVVLDELEFKVQSIAPAPVEEIAIKEEIQKVFEQHPTKWLSNNDCKLLLLDNPRTMKKLEEHYKQEYEKKITSTIPLIVHALLQDGMLMQDKETSSYRWKPHSIDFETADFFQSKEILDLLDSAYLALSEGETDEVVKNCEKILWTLFSKINALFENRIDTDDAHQVVAFLERLKIDISKPIPLDVIFYSLKETTPGIDETKVWLQTTILYAKRLFAKIDQLSLHEPRNQEIISKLKRCKTGVLKEREREYLNVTLLPLLMKSYGKTTECMSQFKTSNFIAEKIPSELEPLVENKQILPAKLYKCPIDEKQTIVSASSIEAMNCSEHAVPLTYVKNVYILSDKTYQAWNVWMEEYTKTILQKLPCRFVESGIALRPVDAVGVHSPEEVDLAVVFNGHSVAVECMENVSTNQGKDDLSKALHKLESLGLFDFFILVYKHVDNPQSFDAFTRKHQKTMFPVLVKNPKDFEAELHLALMSAEEAF